MFKQEYENVWLQKQISMLYPALRVIGMKLLIAVPLLVEF